MSTILKEKSYPRWFCGILIEVIWHCTEKRFDCPCPLFLFLIPVISGCSLQGFVPKKVHWKKKKEVHWNISRGLTFIPRYIWVGRNTSSALGQEKYNSVGFREIQRGLWFHAYQSRMFPSKGSLPDAHGSEDYGMGFWDKNFNPRWSSKKTGSQALKSVPPSRVWGKIKGFGGTANLEANWLVLN